jgi:hypothetical protein
MSEKVVAVYETNMKSGYVVRLGVPVSLLKISFNTKKNMQDVPVFVSVIVAAVTGDPGGCGLTVELSCHGQRRIKMGIL